MENAVDKKEKARLKKAAQRQNMSEEQKQAYRERNTTAMARTRQTMDEAKKIEQLRKDRERKAKKREEELKEILKNRAHGELEEMPDNINFYRFEDDPEIAVMLFHANSGSEKFPELRDLFYYPQPNKFICSSQEEYDCQKKALKYMFNKMSSDERKVFKPTYEAWTQTYKKQDWEQEAILLGQINEMLMPHLYRKKTEEERQAAVTPDFSGKSQALFAKSIEWKEANARGDKEECRLLCKQFAAMMGTGPDSPEDLLCKQFATMKMGTNSDVSPDSLDRKPKAKN